MNTKRQTKLIHEGEYIAEVDIELIVSDDEWSPYLSVEDALKLDQVRLALRNHNFTEAMRIARVYRLMPLAA